MDTFAQWATDACVTGEGCSAYTRDLLDSYREFSGQRVSSQWLGHRLRERGFTKSKSGKIRWSGIGIEEGLLP